jgi:hypothetical protein
MAGEGIFEVILTIAVAVGAPLWLAVEEIKHRSRNSEFLRRLAGVKPRNAKLALRSPHTLPAR